MTGCTRRPLNGAAIQSAGIASTLAPSVWKMRLTFEFCNAKPNCRPMKPKHMFQICQKLSDGRVVMARVPRSRSALFCGRGLRRRTTRLPNLQFVRHVPELGRRRFADRRDQLLRRDSSHVATWLAHGGEARPDLPRGRRVVEAEHGEIARNADPAVAPLMH